MEGVLILGRVTFSLNRFVTKTGLKTMYSSLFFSIFFFCCMFLVSFFFFFSEIRK